MKVQIEERPALRLAALSHVGPYYLIGQAFGRLGAIVQPAGLVQPGAALVAVYPATLGYGPEAEQRSDAGLIVTESSVLPAPLHEVRLPAGRYARLTHVGPYDQLGVAWDELTQRWLPASGERARDGASYEVYRKRDHARPAELETDLYLPLA